MEDAEYSSNNSGHEESIIQSVEEWKDKGFAPIARNTMFKDPQGFTDNENKTAIDCGMSSLAFDISKLPPLQEPLYKLRRQESNVGISLVITVSLILIGVTHGIALTAVGGIMKQSTTWWVFFILIYTESGMALILLAALLLSDPGVVRRSNENSFPIPLQCEDWISAYIDGRSHEVQPPNERYIGCSDADAIGDSYCVRCLVWRRLRESKSYFHCSICQRCVMHYDHHCSVFGRCIGGTLWRGNYRFFVGLIAVGILSYWTSVTCLLWSLSLRYKPQIAVPVTLFLMWLATATFMGRIGSGTCNKCRSLAIQCTNTIRKCFKI